MSVYYKPNGYHDVSSYIVVKNANDTIKFAENVFNAIIVEKMEDNGEIMHAEFQIGDTIIMIGNGKNGSKLFPAMLYVYVENVDKTYKKAMDSGAISIMEPQNQFYGDRNAAVEDSCGNQWWIATHRENLSSKELEERLEKIIH
ncbi:MAG: VOC family protein [Candidatus Marinimicrobia bacterium]|nr:VOC family protein [Candidatus Neomarinimicrobiota bacterium]